MLDSIIDIAREAGTAILAVYESADFGVETKSDDSPLTKADLAAHQVIVARLNELAPDIPVLSEESGGIPFSERGSWQRYFLVDPLDGTKEFINRNGEFTVNIALIDAGKPVIGVVHVPVTGVTYAGNSMDGNEAFVERDGERSPIRTRSVDPSSLVVVASRRHGGEALTECLAVLNATFDAVDLTNMGSSLKLCLVAEGKADFYPRLAPTSEWDTAAAQGVVEAAGGLVVDTALAPLRYNTKDDILNPFFYVIADTEYDWATLLGNVRPSA